MKNGKEKISVSISKYNLERMNKLGIRNISMFIDNVLTDYLDYIEERLKELDDDEKDAVKKMLSYPYLAVFALLD